MIIKELKTLQKKLQEVYVGYRTHYNDKCPSGFRKRKNCIDKRTSSKSSMMEDKEFLKDKRKNLKVKILKMHSQR